MTRPAFVLAPARCLLPSVLALLAASPRAQERAAAPVEDTFYRAFFFDRGERAAGEALRLYEAFLATAPEHALAGPAARNAYTILRQEKREEAAAAFAAKHARLLALSAKPGINAPFLDPNLKVQEFLQSFEGESREIYRHRQALAKLVGLREGQAVADVGAGTGLFTWIFARAVGAQGKVYAVEISTPMLEHLEKTARNGELQQVSVVACTDRSSGLAEASVDVVFVCDTYHHFEFPLDTLRSIHKALRPGGQLVVIDFERIPGQSREWILGHVRAGKEVVIREIESSGFALVGEEKTALEENYFLRFQRR